MHVGVYLPQSVFSHGLKILITYDEGEDANITTNVVYKEVFRNLWLQVSL